MKKKVTQFLLTLLCAATIISCNNDDEPQLTRLNGKPSSLRNSTTENTNVFFSYHLNQLSKITVEKGSISKFNYENNELISIFSSPEDKRMADGHGWTGFKKESGNKIIIESTGEPSFNLYRKELELDENNIPVQITEMGVFAHTGTNGEISVIRGGQYYAVFTFDLSTKNLTRLVVHDKITSEEIATYDYEYDSNTGAISKINLPLWYYAYNAYGNRDYRNSYNRLFFNYSNNIVKEKITKTDHTTEQNTFNYIYQYNKENTPIAMKIDGYDTNNMSITY